MSQNQQSQKQNSITGSILKAVKEALKKTLTELVETTAQAIKDSAREVADDLLDSESKPHAYFRDGAFQFQIQTPKKRLVEINLPYSKRAPKIDYPIKYEGRRFSFYF